VTGDLADALDRDLRTDRLDFDELGWRGLWAYVTKAPLGTAIFQERSQGWQLGDKINAEILFDLRKLLWRYTAVHFEGGREWPFPEQIPYPGSVRSDAAQAAKNWEEVTTEELVSPEVRALLRGE